MVSREVPSYAPIAGILVAALITTSYYIMNFGNHSPKFIKPSPHLNSQSTVIDVQKGVRISTTKFDKYPKCQSKNAYEIFLSGLEKSRDKKCLGKRKSLTDPVKWLTYAEVHQNIRQVGSAITKLREKYGIESNIFGICGRNSPEWVIMEYACAAYSLIVVPLYNTLGDSGIKHIIGETEVKMIFCDTTLQAENMWKLSGSNIQCLIILERDAKFDEFKSKNTGKVEVLSYDDLLVFGQQNIVEPKVPKEEDLFIISYTSGSTGSPKGVKITHKGFLHTVYLIYLYTKEVEFDTEELSHLSYLPLAHVMEQLFMALTFSCGGRSGFLTSSIINLTQDCQLYQPDFFCCVPRILLRVYTDSMSKLHSNFFYRWISDYLIEKRVEEQKRGLYHQTGLLDTFIFRGLREQFGGKMRCVIVGSAPMTDHVMRFSRAAFACPVFEAYGSTETGGTVTVTLAGDMNLNHVGSILPNVRVKLTDVPDMDIIVTRDQMGEICVLSDSNTTGYYKRPDLTEELKDEDGFIKTGDIGVWLPNGALKIVDRSKNIFKLSQGEYVAPEKVEKAYSLCNIVSQVFVDGNSLQPFCVAVIVPDFKTLSQRMAKVFEQRKWNLTKPDADRGALKNEICRDSEVRQFVLESINQVGKANELKGFELVKAVHLSPEPFTTENGLLTPTLKSARAKLRKRFAEEMAELYKQ